MGVSVYHSHSYFHLFLIMVYCRIVQWQDGTFLKEMKEPWVKTQLTSRLLIPVIPVKPGETESDAEKIVSNNKKPLLSSKIKAKTRVDGLDNAEEFENVWVELKGGVGTRHESENSNNREDIDVLLKGFSVMSAMQALTMPEEAKKRICELEFFGIRGIGKYFQFWGCFQTSRYLMCSYLLGEFHLPSFEGREGSGLQELLYAIRLVYSFKVSIYFIISKSCTTILSLLTYLHQIYRQEWKTVNCHFIKLGLLQEVREFLMLILRQSRQKDFGHDRFPYIMFSCFACYNLLTIKFSFFFLLITPTRSTIKHNFVHVRRYRLSPYKFSQRMLRATYRCGMGCCDPGR